MIPKWTVAGIALLWMALGAGSSAGRAWAAPQEQQQAQKPAYTLAEYKAYQAADAEKDPQQKIKLLDEFVSKYPNSALLPYVYQAYYLTDYALKNFGGTVEYADRMIALGDKVDTQARLQAYVARAQAYYVGSPTDKALQTPDAQNKARDAAVQGLKTVDEWKKPDQMAADAYEQQKKSFKVLLNAVAGMASTSLKDYAQAVNFYKTVIALDPNDAISHFRLGVAYLQMNPPQASDGFWEMARSIGLKSPNGPNEAQVKKYMRDQLVRYQQAACDKLIDDQLNQLLTLASTAAERPATLTIPSAADLEKARNDVGNFIPALKAGGDAGKVMWLATCGLEFPDVGVRAMDNAVANGDSVTVQVFRPDVTDADAAQKELESATEANMEVKIVGQPEASRIQKDDQFRFTGTLVGYTQTPFLLSWDKAKINPEDIPEEKATPGKRAPRRAPIKKAPAD